MIIKELDSFHSEDKYAKAGRAAEQQMAFYLKRYFGEMPDVHVLNNVYLEDDGDAAQADHVVIHEFGISRNFCSNAPGKISFFNKLFC